MSGYSSPTPSHNEQDSRPRLRLGFGSDELENAPHRRSQINYNPLRIYSSTGDTLKKGRHLSSDQLAPQKCRQSVILDATDEAFIRIGKRQTQTFDDNSLAAITFGTKEKKGKMVSFTTEDMTIGAEMKSTVDSMYESFRWLEDDDELDLRLVIHDDTTGLHSTARTHKRHPSFRRHLSMSKLPFSSRTSTTSSRPTTKDAMASPTFKHSPKHSPTGSIQGSPGHARRRSRALSLITPNKQPIPEAAIFVDPAAAHYQDPDARMKLRVYLASPHKFDEAVEFGFPAIEEVQSKECSGHKRTASHPETSSSTGGNPKTFLEDDKSSIYSDEASASEPESPRTPEATEKPLAVKTPWVNHDQDPSAAAKVDYAQAPVTSREMTLRMTLTRPDLRANEDQIYGWQKGAGGRKPLTREEPLSPTSLAREGNSKESIERQFAALDQEELANDNGVMRRFWNRVRRS